MSTLAGSRPHYISDGGIRVARFWAIPATALPAAVVAGALMNWLLHQGWYLIGLVPLVAAMLVGAATAVGVILSHCRNRLVAALAGGTAGLAMYLAYYYFGMLGELPPGHAHRVDLFPQYILARLETDVKQDLIRPRRGNGAAQRPRWSGNVAIFILDITCSIVVAGCIPYLRARRPYMKELGQWMAKEEKRLPAGTLEDFEAAWESGNLQLYAEQAQASLLGRARAELGRHCANCTLEYVRHPSGSPLEHPIYLSYVDDVAAFLTAMFRRNRDFYQVQLLPEEALALRSWFPNLNRIISAFPSAEADASELSGSPTAAPVAGDEAVVIDVPGGGRFRSPAFLLTVNLLALIPLLTFFGGLALIVAGFWGLWRGWELTTWLACLLWGGLALAAGCVQATKYGSAVESWYAGRRLRGMLQLRPDAIVRADDPEAEVIDLTTREHWSTVKLDTLDDIGLLAVDDRRGELKIEADKRRYRIPLAAILECQTECFHHPLDKQMQNQYWHVRLRYATRGEPRELLFSLNFKGWTPRTNENRRALAESFCSRIEPLRTQG